MRILQIIHDHERGGIQTLAAMVEAGMAPHRFVFTTAHLFPRPGLPTLAKLGCALRMAYRILQKDYDALIAYQTSPSILVGIVGWLRRCRVRVVHQTCMPSETAAPVRWLDRLAGTLGLYTANVVNSAATCAAFDAYPPSYRRSLILIEHGLDAPAPAGTRAQARARFGLPQSRRLLLNVGRLVEQKNQEVLISALAELADVHLVLVGAGLNETSYRTLARRLGVAERVHMLGALPEQDVADLYLAADLFAFPSRWETFGLAAVEAAMLGVPIVAADLPVLREVLHADGAAPAAFVAADDVSAWVAAIRAVLAAPPRPQAVIAFAQAMRRKYSRARMIAGYLALFGQQSGDRRGAPSLSRLPAAADEVGR
jgi:glycosyltransferase involved in cell wall biosynthesis